MVDLIDTIVYAGRLKDKSALMSSSSGGAFTALSDFFLKNGNAVVVAVYNYEKLGDTFKSVKAGGASCLKMLPVSAES